MLDKLNPATFIMKKCCYLMVILAPGDCWPDLLYGFWLEISRNLVYFFHKIPVWLGLCSNPHLNTLSPLEVLGKEMLL